MATKAKNVEKPHKPIPVSPPLKSALTDYTSDLDVSEDKVIAEGNCVRGGVHDGEPKADLGSHRSESVGEPVTEGDKSAKSVLPALPADVSESGDKHLGDVTPVKRGRPKADAPGAPKKKKAKKKGLLSVSPSNAAAPQNFYDIEYYIVATSADVEKMGLPGCGLGRETAKSLPTSTPAPWDWAVLPMQPILDRSEEEELPWYTFPKGSNVELGTIFCPDCGLRISKHGERKGSRQGKRCWFYTCPDD